MRMLLLAGLLTFGITVGGCKVFEQVQADPDASASLDAVIGATVAAAVDALKGEGFDEAPIVEAGVEAVPILTGAIFGDEWGSIADALIPVLVATLFGIKNGGNGD